MSFTWEFIKLFFVGMYYAAPVLLFLIFFIVIVGQSIGKKENWTPMDSLYYSFITATTVGYGDYHPKSRYGKFAAIGIAILGLLLTGIIVALGVKAASMAFQGAYELSITSKS